ncbi:MAG: regulatory protein RecX, partial [Burkholderiaceae bacterium]
MARAVGLLARREHSRVELARKLQRYLEPDDDASEIDRVLDRLQAQNLLSDARFAQALVTQRAPRYGDLRMRRDLRDRGVESIEADAAMEKLRGTEIARAQA